ncbi:serine/threonine protein kinase [Marinicella meishanensis]|uniref:serine/threonine protein kinase n=1 Tax=Marinicella meishanensis TaxID=2873263 RepID=UPI001CBED62B|nr:serine/threonine protein kinase [Marinicella sp. NBU2979]
MPATDPHPFDDLNPELILDAIQNRGLAVDGRVNALNSYENRVYQIGIQDQPPVIAKFYRPQRWSQAQIQEEHDFCQAIKRHDIPVVTPMQDAQGSSLYTHAGFCFSLFRQQGGHALELDQPQHLAIMGRTLARLHRIGAVEPFAHRPPLNAQTFGHDCMQFVADQFIPMEHQKTYQQLATQILPLIETALSGAQTIRVHGDLHVGNILLRDEVPHLVDFDDARQAPAIQDIWMLLSGEPDEQQAQLDTIIAAYQEFRDFPFHELPMIESLRTLRLIHHTAWLARRWDDPAFPPAFPWFDTPSYWHQHLQDLNHQLAALQNQSKLL